MRKLKNYQKWDIMDNVAYTIYGVIHVLLIGPSLKKMKKQTKVIDKIACVGLAIANVIFAITNFAHVLSSISNAEYLDKTFGYDDEEDDDDDLEMEDKDLDEEEPVEEKVGAEPEAATAEE